MQSLEAIVVEGFSRVRHGHQGVHWGSRARNGIRKWRKELGKNGRVENEPNKPEDPMGRLPMRWGIGHAVALMGRLAGFACSLGRPKREGIVLDRDLCMWLVLRR